MKQEDAPWAEFTDRHSTADSGPLVAGQPPSCLLVSLQLKGNPEEPEGWPWERPHCLGEQRGF